ncbi:MAG: hypothetical protein G8D58_02200, partial [gamma proteobacterium symbiont of Phacoides pectinatus]
MGQSIEELRREDGVRCVLLMEDGLPMYYPTLYTSMKLRHLSVARQRTILNAIKVLLKWCQYEGINLEERFKSGDHLTELEVMRLLDFCAWDADTHDKLLSGVKLLSKAYQQVSNQSQRIHAIRDYVSFLYVELARCQNKTQVAKAVSNTINSYTPKTKKYTKNSVIALSDEQLTTITEKLMPDHPENPWKAPSIQLRNLLIFSVLYETGMRRGELAGLYVDDVKGNEISIYRRHNNPL